MAKKKKRGVTAACVRAMRRDIGRAAESPVSIARELKRISGRDIPEVKVDDGGANNGKSLRAHIATEVLAAMYSNNALLQKAVHDWDVNGGRRPICVAEWFAGMACEAADALLVELRRPSGDSLDRLTFQGKYVPGHRHRED